MAVDRTRGGDWVFGRPRGRRDSAPPGHCNHIRSGTRNTVGNLVAGQPLGGDERKVAEIDPADARFPLGTHVVELRIADGTNAPVSAFVAVEVKDTTGPSLSQIIAALRAPSSEPANSQFLRPVTTIRSTRSERLV